MSLQELPPELTIRVVQSISELDDLSALSKTCKQLHEVAIHALFSLDRETHGERPSNKALSWAAMKGSEELFERALYHGAVIHKLHSPLLQLAAAGRHEHLFRRLLDDYDLDPNGQDKPGRLPLVEAAGSGSVTIVEMLLARGAHASLADLDNEGQTALYAAARNGHVQAAKLLLNAGANVNLTSEHHGTALHAAAINSHAEMVKILLDYGAETYIQDPDGCHAIEAATYRNCSEETVQALLLSPHNFTEEMWAEALKSAVDKKNLRFVRLLLENGVSADGDDGIPWEDFDQRDAAIFAAIHYEEPNEFLQLLVKHGANVNVFSDGDGTPLTATLANGHYESAKLVLNAGADVNAKGEDDRLPLLIAVDDEHSNLDMVEMILEKGAKVGVTDEDGRTPLAIAVENGNSAVAKMILQRGANPNDCSSGTPVLAQAARDGNVDIVALLMERAANVTHVDEEGYAPIHLAAIEGHLAVLKKLLLKQDPDSVKDHPSGWTPAILAASAGHADILECLAENGFDFKQADDNGLTPLLAAATYGYANVADVLIRAGADVNETTKYGYTPLLLAAENGQMDVFQFLIAKGAKMEVSTAVEMSAFMLAAKGGNAGIVELILERGEFDIAQQDVDGRSALHHASQGGNDAVIEVLLSRGAKPAMSNAKERYGATPLIMAARNGHEGVVKRLMELDDISVDETDDRGRSALYWATRSGSEATKLLLLSAVEEAGIEVSEEEREAPDEQIVGFDKDVCFCDVCGRSTTSAKLSQAEGYECRECRECVVGNDSIFLICWRCSADGYRCRDGTHEWSKHECRCGMDGVEGDECDDESVGSADDDEDADEDDNDEDE